MNTTDEARRASARADAALTQEQRDAWRKDHERRGTYGVAASARILALLAAIDAAKLLAIDWIENGDPNQQTCGWALIAVLEDQDLATLTIQTLGGHQ